MQTKSLRNIVEIHENPTFSSKSNTQSDDDDAVSYTESEKLSHLKLWEMSNTEDLLKAWGEKAAGLRWMHIHSAEYWRKIDTRLNIMGITMSSLISASSLAGSAETFMPQEYIMIMVGMIGLFNVLNQSLQRFYNCSEKAALHDTYARQFGNFHRYISTKMSMSRLDRGSPKQILDYAVSENERLFQESPDPHQTSMTLFKKVFDNNHNKSFAIPDIVGDSFEIQIFDRNPLYESYTTQPCTQQDRQFARLSSTKHKRSFDIADFIFKSKRKSANLRRQTRDLDIEHSVENV